MGTASKAKLSSVFPGGRWGLGDVSFDPAMRPFGQFMLGDGREETGGRPSFPIGLLGKFWQERLDRRQPELIQHDAESGFVDCVNALHATSPA